MPRDLLFYKNIAILATILLYLFAKSEQSQSIITEKIKILSNELKTEIDLIFDNNFSKRNITVNTYF